MSKIKNIQQLIWLISTIKRKRITLMRTEGLRTEGQESCERVIRPRTAGQK